jgi:hypothetical protein
MGIGCVQAINAVWLATKMEDYKRPIALAAYVMSIQLANFPGNQLFRQQGKFAISCLAHPSLQIKSTDAPRYTRGLVIAASCAIAASVAILGWKVLYRVLDNGDRGVEAKADERRQLDEEGRSAGVVKATELSLSDK